MPLYNEPVHRLMKDMIQELELKADETFTRRYALEWFQQKYPLVKPATVAAHLTRLSTNAPSRAHHNLLSDDDVLFQVDSGLFRRYRPEKDPVPVGRKEAGDDEVPEVDAKEEPSVSEEFAFERDLNNYLAKNLGVLGDLRLCESEGIRGVEFPAGGRYIDILAVDEAEDLVVIELKVSRAYDRVVGQTMRYMAWIKENLAQDTQRVRGIIVARSISSDLQLACSLVEDIELFEYQLSLAISKVN